MTQTQEKEENLKMQVVMQFSRTEIFTVQREHSVQRATRFDSHGASRSKIVEN